MTDPEFGDRYVYWRSVWRWWKTILEKERPDAVLPTWGGRRRSNLATRLSKRGTFARHRH